MTVEHCNSQLCKYQMLLFFTNLLKLFQETLMLQQSDTKIDKAWLEFEPCNKTALWFSDIMKWRAQATPKVLWKETVIPTNDSYRQFSKFKENG